MNFMRQSACMVVNPVRIRLLRFYDFAAGG